jgi:hypothetical protein
MRDVLDWGRVLVNAALGGARKPQFYDTYSNMREPYLSGVELPRVSSDQGASPEAVQVFHWAA